MNTGHGPMAAGHRHSRTQACVIGLALLVGPAALLAAAGNVRVTPVVADGRVLASFTAADAWSAEARELVQSGLPLTFSFDVALRRPATVWFDTTLAQTEVAASVKFDALTATYQLTRLRDGRVVRSEAARDERVVREWMTVFDKVTLDPSPALEPNVEYYVRVRLYASPRRTFSLWSLWPWSRDSSSGRASFTFIR